MPVKIPKKGHISTITSSNTRLQLFDREAVGLCSPPAAYTTNASESVNGIIKQYLQYKASCCYRFQA